MARFWEQRWFAWELGLVGAVVVLGTSYSALNNRTDRESRRGDTLLKTTVSPDTKIFSGKSVARSGRGRQQPESCAGACRCGGPSQTAPALGPT